MFLQQSNTIVVTAGLYHSMEIIPKDSFGNIAIIAQKYLTAEIRKVHVHLISTHIVNFLNNLIIFLII